MMQFATLRERDFADLLNYASEEELIRQAQLLNSEIKQKFSRTRSPVADLLRERLKLLNRTIGIAA